MNYSISDLKTTLTDDFVSKTCSPSRYIVCTKQFSGITY